MCRGLEVKRENALAEDDDVHVERLEVRRRVRVLVEAAEADEVVVAEQLDLLARLFGQDVLRRQWVDAKHLNFVSIPIDNERHEA